MNKTWLNKAENKNCILFFNGWGMDENAIRHLELGTFDLCMWNDYNPLESIPEEEFMPYEKIYLVAWSMGVWAATGVLENSSLKFQKAIAINGTPIPIHDEFGIPKAIFHHTLENWNLRNREKFNLRIFGGRKQLELHQKLKSARAVENQRLELENIGILAAEEKGTGFTFHCAMIGQNDLIFSRQNQVNFWQGKVRLMEKDIPHFPFGIFKQWQEIIDL
ncbi:DUF452 family protein [Flexithrix dorotheae]|uniref:DUF452 family protein n=1 Tax=Flexithrix dorotheae TaxID=70993 RepID=UPI0003672081|nr:pimeloyl-ACP methyl esterase BioG family protein [Flexithrix dorotheae]